jgi:hypothetical protein
MHSYIRTRIIRSLDMHICRYFLSSIVRRRRRKKRKRSVFFCFVMGKSFALRFCNTVVLLSSLRRCIYIYIFLSFFFIHFNGRFDRVYRYAVLFLLFFFDSIHTHSLSLSFLFILLQSILLGYSSVSIYVPYVFLFPASLMNEHQMLSQCD